MLNTSNLACLAVLLLEGRLLNMAALRFARKNPVRPDHRQPNVQD